jgi:Holliday junction resolvasome RuvABC ATP-dependent DNA helicase subunit
MSTADSALAESIDALGDIAKEAGVDPAAAREEGLRVAAALAESVPGASVEWAKVARPELVDLLTINQAFMDAASLGRRWRAAPTALLETLITTRHARAGDYAAALTEVSSAAVMLGTAPRWVIDNSTTASAAYLHAAQAATQSPLLDEADRVRLLRDVMGSINAAGAGGLLGLGNAPGGIRPAADADDAADPIAAQSDPAAAAPGAVEPPEPEKTVEELLAELDGMIGLRRVKKEIHRQVALLTVEKMRREAGLKQPPISRHLIFVGNPGTGKTTVARLIGAIYRAIGLLDQGQLVEVDRSELVAGYVGQTAMKTAEVCAKAVGGVLFIDEAYSLTGDQFAQEAVGTLVKEMEDHREDLVVIVAGYPEPMVGFITSNPGLASRFTTTIEFDDYTDDELMAILTMISKGSDYELTQDAERRVRHVFEATPRTPAFGNGRFARTLFEHAVTRHAWRLKDATDPTRDELRLLNAGDFFDQPDEDQPPHPTTQPDRIEELDIEPDLEPETAARNEEHP